MVWKRLTLPTQLHPSLLDALVASSSRPGNFDNLAKSLRPAAQSNEDDPMKTRNRRRPPEAAERSAHLALAIERFRKWDSELVRQYGDLYYRAMGFSVH